MGNNNSNEQTLQVAERKEQDERAAYHQVLATSAEKFRMQEDKGRGNYSGSFQSRITDSFTRDGSGKTTSTTSTYVTEVTASYSYSLGDNTSNPNRNQLTN
ncbi:hypothetical protein RRG08_033622 [Elysia crispata]|uniref:Uncharacterized protein n=1 Tax=Elysia crispata TaxID=231223 RepID=A0AAE1CKI6_9GAST|nr:hypothetical protein RRG08_033622 [Elysia crispata]